MFADRLLDRLFQWLDAPLVKQAGGEVARECHPALWEHIYQRTRGMSLAQAQGYVRAAAPAFVEGEVDAVLNWRRADLHLRPRVAAEATEQVIAMVTEDLRRMRTRSTARAA